MNGPYIGKSSILVALLVTTAAFLTLSAAAADTGTQKSGSMMDSCKQMMQERQKMAAMKSQDQQLQ